MVNYSTGGKYHKEKFSQNEGTFIFLFILKKSSYIKMKSIMRNEVMEEPPQGLLSTQK